MEVEQSSGGLCGMHIRLTAVQKISGLAARIKRAGDDEVWLDEHGALVSNDPRFHKYVSSITQILFPKDLPVDSVSKFLILIHEDWSADLYINDILVEGLEILAMKNMQAGERVYTKDIGDIRRLKLFRRRPGGDSSSGNIWDNVDEITPADTDKVVYCFKRGWKFGLVFDLRSFGEENKLDFDKLTLLAGQLYRFLSFEEVYTFLEGKSATANLAELGWFPFIQILGGEFERLSSLAEDSIALAGASNELVDKFNEERVVSMSDRWWNNSIFQSRKKHIVAAINAFHRGEEEDVILCIDTLYPQIEGVIRLTHFEQEKGKHVSHADLCEFVRKRGEEKFGSDYSLPMPKAFYRYLSDNIFGGFDLSDDERPLSRQTAAHGVSKPEDYTKTRALQALLILDQLYSFLG